MIKIKNNINLNELLQGFEENENTYYLNSIFDEFISVNKNNRIISEYGYTCLLHDWFHQDIIEII
jgi:hypothetical protein